MHSDHGDYMYTGTLQNVDAFSKTPDLIRPVSSRLRFHCTEWLNQMKGSYFKKD